MGSTLPNLDRLISMAALAAARLVLAPSIEAGAHTPASFSQTEHVTAAQLGGAAHQPGRGHVRFPAEQRGGGGAPDDCGRGAVRPYLACRHVQ
jgi:hypothetical protein